MVATPVTPVVRVGAAARAATPIAPIRAATGPGDSAVEILAKGEERKVVRAEQNRHSAAASQEHKKQCLNELEQKVSVLSQRNKKLQIKKIHAVALRVERESSCKLKMKN